MELAELHVTRRVRAHASGAALVDFLDASSFGNVFRIVPEELRPALRSELASTFDARREPEGVVTPRLGGSLRGAPGVTAGCGSSITIPPRRV